MRRMIVAAVSSIDRRVTSMIGPAVLGAKLSRIRDLGRDAGAVDIVVEVAISHQKRAVAAHSAIRSGLAIKHTTKAECGAASCSGNGSDGTIGTLAVL